MTRTIRFRAAWLTVPFAWAALVAGEAQALTCYVVLDRNENAIYRDVYPPVDLSDAGRGDRDAMRLRGEFMLFMESEVCPRLEFFTGSAGTVNLRLDQTLAPTGAESGFAKPAKHAAPATPAAPKKPATRAY